MVYSFDKMISFMQQMLFLKVHVRESLLVTYTVTFL